MESSRLEKYKREYKNLAPKITSLQSYLEKTNKASKGISLVTPYQISQLIGVDEMAAFFILSLAEKEHLVSKKYAVFSNDNTLIGEFESETNIPEKIVDPETGQEVDRSHYYVQISFEIEK